MNWKKGRCAQGDEVKIVVPFEGVKGSRTQWQRGSRCECDETKQLGGEDEHIQGSRFNRRGKERRKKDGLSAVECERGEQARHAPIGEAVKVVAAPERTKLIAHSGKRRREGSVSGFQGYCDQAQREGSSHVQCSIPQQH
jgi:hypothetical protein